MSEKHTCCAIVWSGSFTRPSCGNNAKFCRDGNWYCGTHDPVSIAERQAKRDDKARPRREREELESRKRWKANDMFEILERINNGEGWSMEEVKALVEKVRCGYGS